MEKWGMLLASDAIIFCCGMALAYLHVMLKLR